LVAAKNAQIEVCSRDCESEQQLIALEFVRFNTQIMKITTFDAKPFQDKEHSKWFYSFAGTTK
jgi:hypothetical protein